MSSYLRADYFSQHKELLDDLIKVKLLELVNVSGDQTAVLEDCTITCVATLVFVDRPQVSLAPGHPYLVTSDT